MGDQYSITWLEDPGLWRFDHCADSFVSATIDRIVEPFVHVVRIHPVVHTDCGNFRLYKDRARLYPRVGTLIQLDGVRFWDGQNSVELRFS
jgi:hypothetical protein